MFAFPQGTRALASAWTAAAALVSFMACPARGASQAPDSLSLRAVYETDPAIAAAVTPRPLAPSPRGEVCVTFPHVAMHIRPGLTIEIGSGVFGVRSSCDGVEGIYLLTMPMTAETAVLGGRDNEGDANALFHTTTMLAGKTVEGPGGRSTSFKSTQ